MKQLRAKLNSSRGETLVELMAAILVAALSVGLLLGCVTASVNLNRQAKETDGSFYQDLTAAEAQRSPVRTGQVSVTEDGQTVDLPVQVYGSGELWSYALVPTPAGGGGT